MAASLPEDFLDEVRSRTDIVELIGEYVTLKRTGRNYVGLCPFHAEKTPSFTVSPDKQIFYCFGCGAGGNVFSFLMKRDHLTFPEAVEVLAGRLGLEVPRRDAELAEQHRHRELHYELNAQVACFYHSILKESEEGEEARLYLKNRGIDQDSWVAFQLGFAPNDSAALLQYLKERGFTISSICRAGILSNQYGRLQNRLQGRVIFPIFDGRGRCLGFGGRTLGDGQPKYLNSAESDVFSKSRSLYGLNLAQNAIREQGRVLVVEGYLDCISAHQHGFTNTVAALGTAFTHEQARLLLRYTRNVVLAFDSDSAGSAANLRGAGYLQELGAEVSVLELPSGKDPDEFLKTRGSEAFREVLRNHVQPYLVFKLHQLMKQHDPAQVSGRAAIVECIMDDLQRVENIVAREGYIRLVASELGTTEEAVRGEMVRYLARKGSRKDRNEKNRHNMEQDGRSINNPAMTAPEAARRGLFRLICQDHRVWELVKEELGLAVFQGKLAVFLDLLEKVGWGHLPQLLDRAAEEDRAELAGLLMGPESQEVDAAQQQKMLEDYLYTLKKERLSLKIERITGELRKCEKNGDSEGIKDLLAELHYLYSELESLKTSAKQKQELKSLQERREIC